MRTSEHPPPSVRTLLAAWWSLGGWIARAFAAKVEALPESGADAVKDSLLDASLNPGDDAAEEACDDGSLSPIRAEDLAQALRGPSEETYLKAAAILNEDAFGCWPAVTQERVLALFAELGQEALRLADELQLQAEEAAAPPGRLGQGEWASRYRRMLALGPDWHSKSVGPQYRPPATPPTDHLLEALVYAMTYVLYRAEQGETRDRFVDGKVMDHLADTLRKATGTEKETLAAAVRRALADCDELRESDLRRWVTYTFGEVPRDDA
jgi:hypothetical protein